MIAAGIGDNAARSLIVAQRRDFVVCAAEFEGADRLQVFRLEVEPVAVPFQGD
jgi:hypothetical protein